MVSIVNPHWTTVSADKFCDSVKDGTHDSPKEVPFGRYLVTSRHITSGRVDLTEAYRISERDFDEINRRSKVDTWDVLLSMIGTVGEACLITEEPNFAIKNVGLFKSRTKTEGQWLYYYLRSPFGKRALKERARGTTQEYVPLGELRKLPIIVPETRREMEAIVSILSTLDEKIELNRRMNETLEAIARALFKSWFVDFDPVRAKASGEPPESICRRLHLTPDLLPLFPDRLQESELGEIPEGWKFTSWGALVSLEYGKSLKGYDRENGEYPVYGTNGRIGSHSKSLCNHPGIIIGRKGAYRGVHYCSTPFYIIDTAFFIEPKLGTDLHWAYYELLRQDINSMDSGSAIPSTSREDFYSLPVLSPPVEVQAAFAKFLSPFWSRQELNISESRTLVSIRAALLPKLISGELQVKDCHRKAPMVGE